VAGKTQGSIQEWGGKALVINKPKQTKKLTPRDRSVTRVDLGEQQKEGKLVKVEEKGRKRKTFRLKTKPALERERKEVQK